MRTYFSEKNLVGLLFIVVLVVFSIAQSETQKMGKANGTLLSSAKKATHKNLVLQGEKGTDSLSFTSKQVN